jgi:hypothetical protein
MLKIELSDMADVMKCISEYERLANSFTQRGSKEDKELMIKFWNEKVVKRETKTWITPQEFDYWKDIDFHVVKQEWGNTAGGWGGIGGASMTSQYTVIIENYWFGFVCVYYHGKLAYICEMDSKYQEYMVKGYGSLPGIEDCRKNLTVIYKFVK